MINMERTLMAPGFDNTEADQKRALATWSHPTGFEKLDTIHTSEEALNDMVAMFETMEDRGIDLLEKPALPEFTLSAREPAPLRNPRSVLVRYKRSAMRDAVTIPVGDDCTQVTKPVIDAYVSFNKTDAIDIVMTLYAVRIRIGEKTMTATGQEVHWINRDTVEGCIAANDKYDPELFEVYRGIKMSYLAIQRALKHRPTVFYTSTGKKQAHSENGEYIPQKHADRAVRMICINDRELRRYTEPIRHMNCPCWGVIGHMRRYKSGKEVWIKPYRKGKERNNPEAYQAKQYLMED